MVVAWSRIFCFEVVIRLSYLELNLFMMESNSVKYLSLVRRSTVLALPIVAITMGSPCWAIGWEYEPFASLSLGYDDNVRLTSNPDASAQGRFEAGVAMQTDTEVTQTEIRPMVRWSRYPSETELNTDEQFLGFSTRYLGELSSLGLKVDWSRTSSVTSELQDTGRVSVNAQRSLFSFGPSWSYRLTSKNTVNLSGSVQRIRWPDDELDTFDEYNNNEVKVGFDRELTPLLAFNSRAYQRNFESIETGFQADTVGLELGFSKEFTERTKASILVGGWTSDLEEDSSTDSITGTSTRIDVQHKTALASVKGLLTQDLIPSSLGNVREDVSFQITTDFKATARMSWGVAARWQRSESAGGFVESRDRTYYQLRPFVAWRLNRQLQLKSSLDIAQQKLDDQAGNQNRNRLLVSLEYRKDKRPLY